MNNVFMAGPDLVRWDLTALAARGPYRLTVHPAHGSIVEYFSSPTAALVREQQLEDLPTAGRGVERSSLIGATTP